MPFPIATARVCALVFLASTNAYAQETRSFFLNHKLSVGKTPLPISQSFVPSQPETIRVLAALVEFSPDNDPLTTGNGLFDTSVSGQTVDPPPHDKAYFKNHLLFLHNYWKKVTNGTIIVVADVVDSVIRLSREMRSYSPRPTSTTNLELAQLIHDAWRHVDSARLTVNSDTVSFSDYKAFCIFHAGVGRDIDLSPIFGFDPTPNDIPSLFLDSLGLQRAFGTGYRGVPVQDSSFYITNSIILPETESRSIPSIGGPFLLQLGINGLLAASFGSYLGLPDLFDTRTGRSGIGRFGLMDGESIFSWGGVFPPEPSAWEKYFLDKKYGLGMLRVVEPVPGQSGHDLQAVSMDTVGQDTVLFIPMSAKEFFLVENRNRDTRRDSVIVWRVYNGNTYRQAILRDTVGLADRGGGFFELDSLYGVVIDVDEFDFSVPGGVSQTGEFFDGGILIWHVDENIIDANYASNTVNANPARRGIDVEEADGSQDIGHLYEFIEPGSGSEPGTALDFWFNGNIAPVYRNEFSQTTHPNSLTNSGANSHITLKDFALRGPTMQVTVQRGDSLVKPLPGYPKFVGKSNTDGSPQFSKALFVSVGDSLFAFRVDTAVSATPDVRGLFDSLGGRYPVAFVPSGQDTTIVVGVHDSSLFIWKAVDVDADSIFDSIGLDAVKFSARLATAPVAAKFNRGPFEITIVYAGDETGNLLSTSLDGAQRTELKIGDAPVSSIALLSIVPLSSRDFAVAASGDMLGIDDGRLFQLPHTSSSWQIVTLENRIIVADIGAQTLLMLDNNFNVVHRASFSSGISPLAVADVDGDGRRDVIFGAGDRLYVMNQIGAMVDYFPVTLPAVISGAPVVARLTGETRVAHILITTTNGLVTAYNSKGKLHPGFPLAIAGTNTATPALFSMPTGTGSSEAPVLFVTDTAGFVSGWQLASVSSKLITPWGSYRGNISHTGTDTTALIPAPASAEFLPASRAYNWPNPVYDGKTFIRYFVNENATVQIKVYDLSGELVEEFRGPGIGGFDNEVEWNVSKVQSGIYFGRIEAESGGQRGVAIIKIAVVK